MFHADFVTNYSSNAKFLNYTTGPETSGIGFTAEG